MVTAYHYCVACGAANPTHDTICFACGQSLKTTLPLSAEQLEDDTTRLLQERYQILAEVGKGGFATVYKARDTQSGNRLVAIKKHTSPISSRYCSSVFPSMIILPMPSAGI